MCKIDKAFDRFYKQVNFSFAFHKTTPAVDKPLQFGELYYITNYNLIKEV